MKWIVVAGLLSASSAASAECVIGMKSATSVSIVGSTTLLFTGGIVGRVVVQTLEPVRPGARFAIGKDSFCDVDSRAIYMDGRPLQIEQVTQSY